MGVIKLDNKNGLEFVHLTGGAPLQDINVQLQNPANSISVNSVEANNADADGFGTTFVLMSFSKLSLDFSAITAPVIPVGVNAIQLLGGGISDNSILRLINGPPYSSFRCPITDFFITAWSIKVDGTIVRGNIKVDLLCTLDLLSEVGSNRSRGKY